MQALRSNNICRYFRYLIRRLFSCDRGVFLYSRPVLVAWLYNCITFIYSIIFKQITMKTHITIIFIAISLYCSSQIQQNFWRLTPDTVCAGDSIKLDYKLTSQGGPNNTYYVTIPNPFTILWQGTYAYLAGRPKEHYVGLNAGDSTYYMYIHVPSTAPTGTQHLHTSGTQNDFSANLFYIKDCTCIISANFSYTLGSNGAVTFSSTSAGTTSQTTYVWNFGNGSDYTLTPVTTNTYFANGNYSVTLTVTNPKCTNTVVIPITVNSVGTTITGIPVYQPNAQVQVYFDIYGNEVEKRPNEVLIEQIGTKRRKVVFQ